MKPLALLCFIFLHASPTFATICPEGFDDNGSGCYSQLLPQASSAAYGRFICNLYYNSFLYIIQNAFQNSHIQTVSADNNRVWLGLHCFDKSSTSCAWDNGKQMGKGDYSHFAKGHPDPNIGACVYMDVQSGQWYSSDCTQLWSAYGCSYIPQTRVPECPTASTPYLNGNCYYQLSLSTANETFAGCQHQNGFAAPGNATSIHSLGENSFIRDWSKTWIWDNYNRKQDNYVFIGLEKNTGGSYVWSDGTPSNFLNFGASDNSKDCALMQFGDNGLVKSGQWVPIGCNETPDNGKYSRVWSVCAYPYIEEPPLPPIDCSKPIHIYLNDTDVSIYSPGYPLLTSSPIVCTYIVTVPNYKARLNFNAMLIDSKSSVKVYDGTPEDGKLLISISNVYEYGEGATASGKVISLVFNTTGQYANRFQAFGGVEE